MFQITRNHGSITTRLLTACSLALPALGAGAPSAPMLNLETGMHASGVSSISADASGRLVLTVGDSEARLWSLESSGGRPSAVPLRVFHAGGELNWGTLSPDGNTVALTGGSMEGKDGYEIRLYDTTNGRFLMSLHPTGSVIELAFSEDGRLLAAGLRGGYLEAGGVNVFSLPSRNLVARGKGFLGSAYNLRWLTGDRLAASTDHGEFYLYDARSWRDGTVVSADSVTEPLSSRVNEGDDRALIATSISDDGSCVVFGSSKAPDFSVFGPDFSTRMFRPSTEGIHKTNTLSRLSWSRDAKVLAGVFFSSASEHELKGVRIWDRAGTGPPRDIPTGPGRIYAMRPLPGNEGRRFLVGTSRPASWSVINADEGHTADFTQHFASSIPDFSDDAQNSHFRVSDDGMTVAFGTAGQGRMPAVFSVQDRRLAAIGNLAEINAHPPRPAPRGVKLAQRPGYSIVELNGKKLDTGLAFSSFCWAFAPDDSFFVLGAGEWLGQYDRTGKKIWGFVAHDTVIAVNLSSDGQVAVVACADGTLEWRRTSDGDDFLTAYVSADRHRWVAWTNVTERREQVSFDPSAFMSQLRKFGGRPVRIDGIAVGGNVEGEEEARALLGAESFAAWKRKRNQDVDKKDYDKAIEPLWKKVGVEIEVTMLQRDGRNTTHRLTPASRTDTNTFVAARYYDSAPSGEDLLAWRVARSGEPLADFFPAARFRSVYYRPDIIQRLAQVRDANAAVKQANTALGRAEAKLQGPEEVLARLSPPVVELECGGVFATLDIPADATTAKVRYAIRQTGRTPATRMDIRLNGRPLDISAPLPVAGGSAEVEVPLPDGIEGDLGVIASHDLSSSEAVLLRLRRTGKPAKARKPDLYVIAVGVAKLKANIGLDTDGNGRIDEAEFVTRHANDTLFLPDLEGANRDARKLTAVLAKQEGRAFAKVHVTLLEDASATTSALKNAVAKVAAESRLGDVVIFSFAGHGYAGPRTEFLLATHDIDPSKPLQSALTGSALAAMFHTIRASVVLILDTCQAGAVFGRQDDGNIITGPEDLTGLINTLGGAEHGVVVLSSSSESENAFESDDGGVFTRAVCEGLSGSAANDGMVTCRSLQDFVTHRVPELMAQNPALAKAGLTQTPSVIMPKGVPDFVLARP